MREDRDLTQKEIAKYLNIAARTYSGYENGTRNIPVQIVAELALYYKVSADYLLDLTDDKTPYKRK
ncbi:MAG: helix-turn-helix domain-containing protein [Oscillospiraceae bacterium]